MDNQQFASPISFLSLLSRSSRGDGPLLQSLSRSDCRRSSRGDGPLLQSLSRSDCGPSSKGTVLLLQVLSSGSSDQGSLRWLPGNK